MQKHLLPTKWQTPRHFGFPNRRFQSADDRKRYASFCPEERVHFAKWTAGAKSATRRAPKLLVCNCQTSAEKSGNFTAEVGEVLWCVFQTSCNEDIFSLRFARYSQLFYNFAMRKVIKQPRRRHFRILSEIYNNFVAKPKTHELCNISFLL